MEVYMPTLAQYYLEQERKKAAKPTPATDAQMKGINRALMENTNYNALPLAADWMNEIRKDEAKAEKWLSDHGYTLQNGEYLRKRAF